MRLIINSLVFQLLVQIINSQPTINMTYDQYFQRFTNFNSSSLNLVNAQYVDFKINNFIQNPSSIYKKLYETYYQIIEQNYSIDFYQIFQIKFDILRDPCRGIPEQNCTSQLLKEQLDYLNLNPTVQKMYDHENITAGNDLQIAIYTNASVLQCNRDWERLIGCGTFIEIHRPFDPFIIEQLQIEDLFLETYKFLYFNTKKLCAGKYEIWYVVKSRVGVALQYSVPFYVNYPNCNCNYQIYLQKNHECH